MGEVQGKQTNDLQGTAEFDFRHNLDVNWPMSPFHMHPHYEFYLFIRGDAEIRIEDESFDAHPMDLFIYPPGVLHRATLLDNTKPYERAFFYVTRNALSNMSDDCFHMLDILEEAMRRRDFSYHVDDETAAMFIRLIDEAVADEAKQDISSHLMNRCRANMISLICCRVLQNKQVMAPRPPDRISNVIRYINDNVLEQLSLDALAERFFVSKYTLLHEFKSYTNISVHQYILYKRVLYAQHLMQHGTTPGNAAKQSGFNDYAGFYRAFVRQNTMTPQAYFTRNRLTENTGDSI